MTALQPFTSGIQRVVRTIGACFEAMGLDPIPVGWDRARNVIRALGAGDRASLGFAMGIRDSELGSVSDGWLFLPETPHAPIDAGIMPAPIAHAYGLKVAALLHDLIPAKLPHLYGPTAVDFYETYFRSLAAVDLVITTTHHVAADLRGFLETRRLRVPPVAVCPLGGDYRQAMRPAERASVPSAPGAPFALLMLGSLEPRKNHLRVLEALALAESAAPIRLTIVGRRGHDPAYDRRVFDAAAGRENVTVLTDVGDDHLATLFAASDATIYGSYEEGFGLPVVESLWFGVPCLCHDGSATREIAPGGGAMLVDMLDVDAIAAALTLVAASDGPRSRLAAEARARAIPTWRDCAEAMAAAMGLAF